MGNSLLKKRLAAIELIQAKAGEPCPAYAALSQLMGEKGLPMPDISPNDVIAATSRLIAPAGLSPSFTVVAPTASKISLRETYTQDA